MHKKVSEAVIGSETVEGGQHAELFRSKAPEHAAERLEEVVDLSVVLQTLLDAAHEAHPEVQLDDEAFLAHVAKRLPADGDLRKALLTLHAGDLYVAFGCVEQNKPALEEVDRRFEPSTRPALHKVNAPDAKKDEVIDRLRITMLFGEEGRRPKIEKYAGRGALKSWLSVAAVRTLLSLLRDEREIPVDEDALVRHAAFDEDPALASLKAQYRDAFKIAFAEALASISSRERVLLRHYYVDGLGSDVLAKMHRVHRVTVTRWLARIRENLLEETRFRLSERLRVSGEELDSIMRLIGSQLQVSIQNILVEDEDERS